MTNWDIALLRAIQAHRLPWADDALAAFSAATTYFSIALILGIGLWEWLKTKQVKRYFLWLVLTFFIQALSSNLLKKLFARERPFVVYDDIVKLSTGGSYSFPSGHTTESFALIAAIAWMGLVKGRWRYALWLWPVLVAYSRMALGVHYPGDVVGAILLAFLIVYLLMILRSRSPWL